MKFFSPKMSTHAHAWIACLPYTCLYPHFYINIYYGLVEKRSIRTRYQWMARTSNSWRCILLLQYVYTLFIISHIDTNTNVTQWEKPDELKSADELKNTVWLFYMQIVMYREIGYGHHMQEIVLYRLKYVDRTMELFICSRKRERYIVKGCLDCINRR